MLAGQLPKYFAPRLLPWLKSTFISSVKANHNLHIIPTSTKTLYSTSESENKSLTSLATLPETLHTVTSNSSKGDEVKIEGWVTSCRRQKKWAFINLNDGSLPTPLQVILSISEGSDMELLKKLTTGCSIKVSGSAQPHPTQKDKIEVHANSFELIKECSGEVHGSEFLREHGHLRARTRGMSAILKIRSKAEAALHNILQEYCFTQIHTPVLTSHDCEGGGEVFQVKANGKEFFREPAFLTVSGQLHLEMAANAISRVYTFGPTFRAEPSVTGRHLAEFWMLETEVAFVRDLRSILDLTELLVSKATEEVLTSCSADLRVLSDLNPSNEQLNLHQVINKPFARMTYTEAVEMLQSEVASKRAKFDFPPEWGRSLQSEHEHYLTKVLGSPVFVTHYPKSIKPFYMKLDPASNRQSVACFDLLMPGVGELVGGSLREDDERVLSERLSDLGLSEAYQWYLDLRRFGGVPHGGFGLGVERFIQFLTQTTHIRDTTPYPRFSGNCRY